MRCNVLVHAFLLLDRARPFRSLVHVFFCCVCVVCVCVFVLSFVLAVTYVRTLPSRLKVLSVTLLFLFISVFD